MRPVRLQSAAHWQTRSAAAPATCVAQGRAARNRQLDQQRDRPVIRRQPDVQPEPRKAVMPVGREADLYVNAFVLPLAAVCVLGRPPGRSSGTSFIDWRGVAHRPVRVVESGLGRRRIGGTPTRQPLSSTSRRTHAGGIENWTRSGISGVRGAGSRHFVCAAAATAGRAYTSGPAAPRATRCNNQGCAQDGLPQAVLRVPCSPL